MPNNEDISIQLTGFQAMAHAAENVAVVMKSLSVELDAMVAILGRCATCGYVFCDHCGSMRIYDGLSEI